jgi:multicomponent Na+:H+ antiporter subunit A
MANGSNMSPAILLLLAVLLPLFAAALAPFVGRILRRWSGWLLAFAFSPGIGLLTLAPNARRSDPVEVAVSWVPGIDLELAFRADGFSLVLALLVSTIGFLILIYSASYLRSSERHGRFYSYMLLFGSSMLGLVLADNLVALLVFWELTSISSFLLIGFWGARKPSQDGAMKALVVTIIGGLALLAAVALISIAGDNSRLSEIDAEAFRSSSVFVPVMVLVLLAAFSKSAQVPFHLWLPTAMEAPTPVSAYLHSATMVKAGVVLIAKLGFLFHGTEFSTIVLFFGLATLLWGGYLAMRQDDLKALLAYSTVSQLGLMMALYGSGHTFAATVHLVNHAAFKAALFMVVGIIDHATGSRSISGLSGLARKLPITTALAIPCVLSMAALPPLGGFISKELFFEGILLEGLLPTIIAVVGSILTFAYSFRFLSVFFGSLQCPNPKVSEAKPLFWLPVLPLVGATIAFGFVPWQDTSAGWFAVLAAPAFGYSTQPLTLWHGMTHALALSVLTWFVGLGLFVARDSFRRLQTALTPKWNANTIYYGLIAKVEQLANWVTLSTQGATFTTHLRLIWIGVVLIGTLNIWRYQPKVSGGISLEIWMVAILVLGGVVGVLFARTRLSAIIFAALVGFGATLVFVVLRAPDLALTQLLIETVTVILFLSVFRHLPPLTRYDRSKMLAGFDALIALGVAATVFTGLVAVQSPIGPRIGDFFLQNSKLLAGGKNVVNVILVDFRGYDTLGEITVLGIVAVTVVGLLSLRTTTSASTKEGDRETP